MGMGFFRSFLRFGVVGYSFGRIGGGVRLREEIYLFFSRTDLCLKYTFLISISYSITQIEQIDRDSGFWWCLFCGQKVDQGINQINKQISYMDVTNKLYIYTLCRIACSRRKHNSIQHQSTLFTNNRLMRDEIEKIVKQRSHF